MWLSKSKAGKFIKKVGKSHQGSQRVLRVVRDCSLLAVGIIITYRKKMAISTMEKTESYGDAFCTCITHALLLATYLGIVVCCFYKATVVVPVGRFSFLGCGGGRNGIFQVFLRLSLTQKRSIKTYCAVTPNESTTALHIPLT